MGYQLLVAEGKVAVPINWLATLLSRLRHKDPKLVIKKLMDGFFNPWDLAHLGGTANLDPKWQPILSTLERKLNFT